VSNGIPERQNEEHCLRALAAQRLLYSRTKVLTGVRGVFTALLPLATWLGALRWPQLRHWGVALTAGWMVLDLTLLTRPEAHWRLLAARVQEWFDAYVMDLEWNTTLVGARPSHEDIVDVTHGNLSDRQRVALTHWYPQEVGRIPIGWGRMACQRMNAWWDGSQHRAYARTATTFVVIAVALPTIGGLWANPTLEQYLMTFVAPVIPVLTWGLRERDQHLRAAGKLDELRRSAITTWENSLESRSEPDAKAARALQDQIFDSRRSCPPVFDWFYSFQRASREGSAADVVRDLFGALRLTA
jgi:hypothetical protein